MMGIYADIQKKQSPVKTNRPVGLATIEDGKLFLNFKPSLETVTEVKRLTMRHYNGDNWTAALTLENVASVERIGFELHADVIKWKNGIVRPIEFDPHFNVKGLKHQLERYQLEAIQTLNTWNGRGLLADEQGLGKTVEALGFVAHNNAYPVLIICPSFAKYNWRGEINHWVAGDKKVQIIDGQRETDVWGDFVIINYDILTRLHEGEDLIRGDLWYEDWSTIIIDEAHYISNNDTIRAWAVKQLCTVRQIPHIITITATPGRVRPAQIFNAVNLVNPHVFPSFFKYAHRYCGPKMVYGGQWEFKGSSNETELNDLLTKTVMVRRKKADLFKDLPPKIRRTVLLPGLEGDKVEWNNLSLGNIEKMKQKAVRAKMPAVIQWIQNFLEVEDKLIVFGEHKETLDALMAAFGDIAVRVDGNIGAKEKDEAIHEFQRCAKCGVRKERHKGEGACETYKPNMNARLFIGSSAAKEAATLTAASNVVFVELWWSMGDHEQAEDRAYWRMSDPHGIVSWYLLAANSIEEDIADIISFRDKKMKLVLDGKEADKNMVLSYLVRKHQREESCNA